MIDLRSVVFGVLAGSVVLASCSSSSDDAKGTAGTAGSAGSAGAAGSAGTDAGTDAAALGSVKVHRDSRGTVHVEADDLAGAMYGLGWATARDRLFQMDFSRRWMQGRLAEWFGAGEGGAIIDDDRQQRTLGFHAFAKKLADQLPADVKELLQAYADGVNAFATAPDFALPPAYTNVGETAFEPWTIADSLLVWDRLAQLFNKLEMTTELQQLAECRKGDCNKFPGCEPMLDEEAAHVKNPALASFHPVEPERGEAPRKASHAWVVGASRSTTGKPVLHSDPQTPVTAPSAWYEYHLVAGDVNVRGIGVAGAPGFLIFWNQHLAQGLTAAGGDIADLFALELTPDGKGYVVDGKTESFAERTETILVKGGQNVVVNAKDSAFGPVVDGLVTSVPAGKAYALRHINLWKSDDHTLVAALRMMQAKNLDEYRAALEHWYAPGANALYADGDGHIAYHALLGVPERSTEVEFSGLHGRIPYDGDTADKDWKGPLSVATRPNIVDPEEGYLFSGNHMVVGSWYPHYTGMAGAGDTERSLRLRYLFAEKLHHGKPWDPPSADAKLSPEEVLAIHSDAGSDVVRILRDALEAMDAAGQLSGKAKSTLEALRLWKNQLTMSDPVTPLASNFARMSASQFRNLNYPELACVWGGGEPGISHFLKDIDRGEHDVTAHPDSQKFLIDMAALVWDSHGKPGTADSWSAKPFPHQVKYQSNFFCKTTGIGDEPCSLDNAHQFVQPVDVEYIGTILSQPGNSYSQLVNFADLQASRAVFPPGASEDPASEWFKVQTPTWAAGELAVAPTALETVLGDAVESVNLSQ